MNFHAEEAVGSPFPKRSLSRVPKVILRNQRVSDAKRFFEILSNPNFIYFPAKPRSIEDEKNFLKQAETKK
jgi:hypothetical protein